MAFVPTPFARRLTAHLCRWRRGYDGGDGPMFADWSDGVHPDWRALAGRIVRDDAVKLHSHAAAVSSSQVYALNLFVPWREGRRDALGAAVADALGLPAPAHGSALTVDRVAFEWVPPGALLGELAGHRPGRDEPATGVDVVLWGRTAGGARAVVLVEVKLGEGGFTPCKGRTSRGNRRPDVCASAETFFADPDECYLRRPLRASRERRYWAIFGAGAEPGPARAAAVRAAFPGAELAGACPFAGDAQQPMRNLALARALVQEGMADRAWFVLCAHDANPDVPAGWAAWRALGADPAPVLPASRVLRALCDDGHGAYAGWLADRYRLEAP